jgi:gliding motility-associated-like protein
MHLCNFIKTWTISPNFQFIGMFTNIIITLTPYRMDYRIQWLLLFFLINVQFLAAQTSDVTVGCIPLNIQFTAPSSSGTYVWDFKDGASSDLGNPVHVYIIPGEYLVEFRETINGPLVGTILIKVLPKPDLMIAAEPQVSCPGKPISFTDITVYPPDHMTQSLSWTFGNGSGEVTANPVITYTDAGMYTISLSMISNLPGCSVTKTFPGFVDIQAGPAASFTTLPDPPLVCDPPLTVSIVNTTTGIQPLTYTWDFGNGQQFSGANPPDQFYDKAGSYIISLQVQDPNGCVGNFNQIVTAGYNQLDIFVQDTICKDLTLKITNLAPTGTYQWNFGPAATPQFSSARNPSVTFSQTGTYTVLFSWTNPSQACTIDTSFTVVVESVSGTISMVPDLTCKPPFQIFADINYTGGTYLWTFYPDSISSTAKSPVFTYPEPLDDYSVYGPSFTKIFLELTTVGGCVVDTMRQDTFGFLKAALEASQYRDLCPTDPVTFFDRSYSFSEIVEWVWVFGDGDTLVTTSPGDVVHVYDTCGKFYPHLIATSLDGCRDISYILEIIISCCEGGIDTGGMCKPNKLEICHGDSIQFIVTYNNNLMYYRVEGDNYRLWHCPLAEADLRDTITWTFNHETGSQFVYFSTYDTLYDGGTSGFEIIVNGAWARGNYMTNCTDKYTVMFQDSSMNATNLLWTFPDGTTYTQPSFNHTFADTGDYMITLAAWNQPSGCPPDIDTLYVYIRDLQADFEVEPEVCLGAPVALDASKSRDVNEVCYKGYTWYFPGGQRPRTKDSPMDVVTFLEPCEQEIILVVSDINGCTSSLSKTINVQEITASHTLDKEKICLPGEISASSTSNAVCAQISSWTWTINGMTQTGPQTTFSFPDGAFKGGDVVEVLLKVETELGCSSTSTDTFLIYQPTSLITVNPVNKTICEGQSMFFTGQDFVDGGSFLNFAWNFGNGSNATGKSVAGFFPDAGVFPVQLVFTENATGCDDTLSTDVIVQPFPIASFETNLDNQIPICHPQTVVPLSTSQNPYPLTQFWDFGNGVTSTLANPASVYEKGTWTLTLVVATSAGCADTVSRTYTLVGPEGDFDFDKDLICLGEALTLTLQDTSDVSTWLWDFGDGTQQSGGDPVTHIYDFLPPDSTTNVTLVLTDNTGVCTYQLLKPVPIIVVDAQFEVPAGTLCPGRTVTLNNTSSNATSYFWTFSWGGSSTATNPVITLPPVGSYDITLVATNDTAACDDTYTYTLVVSDLVLTQLFGDTICPGDTATIGVLDSLPGYQIAWTPANLVLNPSLPVTQATPLTTTVFTVMVEDGFGCDATGQVTVVVLEPIPTFPAWDTIVVEGATVVLPGPTSPLYVYSWSPSFGLSCSNCPNPSLTATVDTTYLLTITDTRGCFVREVSFGIDVVANRIEVPNVFTPNGDENNSFFQIVIPGGTMEDIALLKLKVYSRWGNLIYDNETPATGWDGKYKGEDCPMDVYAYVIEVEFIDGRRESYRGDITLVR